MNYESRITKKVVAMKGKAIYDESATMIEIDDEAAGEYIAISQADATVKIDGDEWPAIRAAIDEMVADLRDEDGKKQAKQSIFRDDAKKKEYIDENAIDMRVWRWIEKHRHELRCRRSAEGLGYIEAVTPRDVARAGVAGIAKTTQAESALCDLADQGYLLRQDVKRPGVKAVTMFHVRQKPMLDQAKVNCAYCASQVPLAMRSCCDASESNEQKR
jgi:hypothetical protein